MNSVQNSSIRLNPVRWLLHGLAAFLGLFTAVNLIGGFIQPHFDANLTWIDLRFLPFALRQSFLVAASGALLLVAASHVLDTYVRRSVMATLTLIIGATLHNTWQYYVLWARHCISPGIPVPLSLTLSVLLVLVSIQFWTSTNIGAADRRKVVVGALAWVLLFPVFQMYSLGQTDYRRPSDAAIVFGARVFKDGRLSDALFDRVRTACDLYHSGLVRKLVMSGGPGDGPVPEVEAMRRIALQRGVRAGDIVVDPEGVNTLATATNTRKIAEASNLRTLILVSHFYHLPRAKLAFQRAGIEAVTIPARETYFLAKMPIFILREVAAYWTYYLGLRRQ